MRQNGVAAGRQRAVRIGQQRAVLVRQEESRGDGVDPDPDFGQMGGQPLREVADRGFRSAVGGDLGQRTERIHRRDVDDDAFAGQRHVAGEHLGRQQRADEVQIENEGDAGRIQIEEGNFSFGGTLRIGFFQKFFRGGALRMVAAGSVDQNVARTKLRLDLFMGGDQAFFFQDVGGKADRGPARGIDLVRNFLCGFQFQVEDRDFGAAGREGFGHAAAQNPAAAGHDCGFAFQIHFERYTHFFPPV